MNQTVEYSSDGCLRVPGACVRPILDGYMMQNPAILIGADRQEIGAFFPSCDGGAAKHEMACFAFLIESDAGLTLIDAGSGEFMGQTVGHLLTKLDEVGVKPCDIAHILLTHMHVDHAAGLVSPEGVRIFESAQIFVSEAEAIYWSDPARTGVLPDSTEVTVRTARMVLEAYRGRISFVEAGALPTPCIEPVPLPGHTPGHIGFRIGSADDHILMFGDVIHFPHVQAPRPAWYDCFDVLPFEAVATRRKVLRDMAKTGAVAAGAHLDEPGFGHVVSTGPDTFAIESLKRLPGPGTMASSGR